MRKGLRDVLVKTILFILFNLVLGETYVQHMRSFI